MSPRSIGRILTAVGALLVASIVVAPAATAQAPEFSFDVSGVPGAPVTPIEQIVAINLDYSYSIKIPLQNLGGPLGSAQVTFDVNCPQDKILVSGGLTDLITLSAQQTAPYEDTVTIRLTVLREAQGLVPVSCTVSGSVGAVQSPTIPASNPDSENFQIIPDYFSLIEAQTASKLRQGGPQKQIPFAIDLTNYGNAGTKVSFAIESAPKGKWQGLLPDPVLLDPPGGNLQSKQIVFNVATPYKNGWNNEEGAFTISMTPEYQFNSEKKGSPITATVLARVRGVYVPGLEPTVMLAALVGSALVLRMRSDEE